MADTYILYSDQCVSNYIRGTRQTLPPPFLSHQNMTPSGKMHHTSHNVQMSIAWHISWARPITESAPPTAELRNTSVPTQHPLWTRLTLSGRVYPPPNASPVARYSRSGAFHDLAVAGTVPHHAGRIAALAADEQRLVGKHDVLASAQRQLQRLAAHHVCQNDDQLDR